MKKFFILLALAILPLSASAQAQINTKKVKISDFPEKVTKVVLTGNVLFDAVLKKEIAARWRVSPYEFCTLNEFHQLNGYDNYYFLISTKGQFKNDEEPSLQFLTLVKGGEGSSSGIDDMLEVVSLPIGSAENPDGRELTFLPAFITILQEYTMDSIDHDIHGYVGLSNYTKRLSVASSTPIMIADSDLGKEVSDEEKAEYLTNGVSLTDINTVDRCLSNNSPHALVSYVAAPSEPHKNSYCYKMLIDTQTYKLHFFRKHKITSKYSSGFANYDLRSIAMTRKENGKND